tara:strand:- start:47 stop:178 length:132 start_codon:yes stop_codon:yes gene_type:complete
LKTPFNKCGIKVLRKDKRAVAKRNVIGKVKNNDLKTPSEFTSS